MRWLKDTLGGSANAEPGAQRPGRVEYAQSTLILKISRIARVEVSVDAWPARLSVFHATRSLRSRFCICRPTLTFGGMIGRSYIVRFANKTIRAWTYEMPDGKLEQFQVAVTN